MALLMSGIRILAGCMLLTLLSTALAEPAPRNNAWNFSFVFENDLFADSDQNYTNGIQIGLISPDLSHYRDAKKLPRWLLPIVERLPFINERGIQRNVGFTLGQKIFTPEAIGRRDLVPTDRPYAGWLYVGAAFHNKNFRRLDTIELQIGFVSPPSLGEQAQNFVHDIRGLREANGWSNQLKTEPGIMVIYERKIRPGKPRHMTGWGYDSIVHYGAAVGNIHTYANMGFEVRVGWNIPIDFGTTLIRPGGEASAPVDSTDKSFVPSSGFSVHAFAGATGRLVLRDIFLDGSTFRDSHDVDKENFAGDLFVGFAVIFGRTKLSYAQIYRSDEFKRQLGGHEFGSVSLSFSF